MKLLKHIYNTDVALCISHSIYIPNKDGYKIKAIWFNIVNPLNVFAIEHDKIFIKAEDMKNWREYEIKNRF